MATITHRFGRAANQFVRETYRRFPLKGHNKRTSGASRLSPASTSFWSGEIRHVAVRRAGNAAGEVTVGPVRCVSADLTTLLHLGDDARQDRDPRDFNRPLGCNKCVPRPDSTRERGLCRFRSFVSIHRTQPQGTRRLFWGHGHIVSVRAYSGDGAHSEPLYKTKTGYYDILEVASAATQAQIKTAYYKQSFIYHPDRNAGSEAATARFSEISEAYTVLGNKALRRKYDRGLLTQSDLLSTSRPTGKGGTGGSGKQSEIRRTPMSADGRGGAYNFDKFFREHYQEQLQRNKDIRARKKEILEKSNEVTKEMKEGLLTEMGLGIILVLTVTMILLLKPK